MPDLSIFDLSGKTAVVTGGSRGIGRTIAEALAAAGARLAVTARSEAGLADTVAAIDRAGGTAHGYRLDVTDCAAIEATMGEMSETLGGIDILFNNAGVEEVRPSLDVDEALWNRILDTNLKGAFFCARAAARRMREDGRAGVIVNLCSLTSTVGIPTAVPYGASKSGLLGMTRGLAAEWAPLGIRVNAIAPGYFRTGMTEAFYEDEAWQARTLDRIPQQRFGAMHDLAGVAVFLASDASAYVTGQCLAVDGGYLASF